MKLFAIASFGPATRTLSIAILMLAAAWGANAQPETFGSKVDALAKAYMKGPVAGLSIAVVRNGKTIYSGGFGFANVEHNVPVGSGTVFHVGSVSKHILAVAILKLVETGKIRLDDDVSRYIADVPTHGRKITVRELLDHTSGLYNYTSVPEAETNERLDLTHQQVLDLIKNKTLDFEPGTDWSYSNTGFYIAGMIVEKVSGRDYGRFIKDELFDPLGLGSMRLCDSAMLVPQLASGYAESKSTVVPGPLMSWKVPFAAGGVCSTAADLAKWEAALDAGRILSPASIKLMREPTLLPDGTRVDYGFGTRLGDLDGHSVFGHTGNGGGVSAALLVVPDEGSVIAVLTNSDVGSPRPLSLASAIARILLGSAGAAKPELAVPANELSAIPGMYISDDGAVELFVKDAKIWFRVPNGPEGPLARLDSWTYSLSPDTFVRFSTSGSHATHGQLYRGGLMMDLKRRKP